MDIDGSGKSNSTKCMDIVFKKNQIKHALIKTVNTLTIHQRTYSIEWQFSSSKRFKDKNQ